MKVHLIAAASFALIVASPAFANGKCTTAAKSKWQPKEALEQQLKDQGYLVRRIKVEGGCYEVYAFDKEGKRANMAYNAETLEKLDNRRSGRELSRVVSASRIAKSSVRVWDAFVRAFHWSLALSVGVAWITAGEWDKAHEVGGLCRGSACRRANRMGLLGIPLRAFCAIRVAASHRRRLSQGDRRGNGAALPRPQSGRRSDDPRAACGNCRDRDNGLASHDRRVLGFGARWSSCIPRSRTASSCWSARMSRVSGSQAGAIARTSFARWSPASSARRGQRTSPDVNRQTTSRRR